MLRRALKTASNMSITLPVSLLSRRGELRKQDSEIQEIKAFSLDVLPKPLAFEHEKMIEDWVRTKKRCDSFKVAVYRVFVFAVAAELAELCL